MAGHEWRLPETGWVLPWLYRQHTSVHQLDVCSSHPFAYPSTSRKTTTHTHTHARSHTSPKCDTWICSSWQKEQVWKAQWWAFVVADNVVTGDREVTQAVHVWSHLSLLSDRLCDLGFVWPFSTKNQSFFTRQALLFCRKCQQLTMKWFPIQSQCCICGIWRKLQDFGGWAFPLKECIMSLELREMTEHYIEGQPHGDFYMFYLIILPLALYCMALYCSGVGLQLETSYFNPGSLLHPPSVAPHTETIYSIHRNNCTYCCSMHNVVKTFAKNLHAIHEFVSPRVPVSGRERQTRVNIDAHSVPSLLRSIWIHIRLRRTNNLEESSSLALLPPGPTECLFIVSLSQQLVLFSTPILLLFLYSPRHSGWISCKFSDELLTKP